MKFKINKIIAAFIIVSLIGITEAMFIGKIIVDTGRNIKEIHAKINAEEMRREKLKQLIKRYDEIESEALVTDVDKLLPNADNFLGVIKEIEDLGKLSGTRLAVSLGEARLTSKGFELPNELRNKSAIGRVLPPGATYDFLEVNMTVRGTYAEVSQFLNLFSQSKYYMNITTMNINRAAANQGVFIDLNLTVEIFVQQVIYD